jgi:putative ABC transport system permease protein
MIVDVLLVAAQVGLLYGPLVLGIYLAFIVVSFPDLTVEGSFGLGGGVTLVLINAGITPALAMLGGVAVGAVAGMVTALLHTRFRVNCLLAGILVATGAWSVSLIIMGAGNISVAGNPTVFTWAENLGLTTQWSSILVGSIVCGAVASALLLFLSTPYGLSLRATGRNIQTARGLGIRTENRQVIGLMIANALAGFSGSLVAQNNGFHDVQSQVGVVVIGLAGLIIGQTLIRSPHMLPNIVSVLLGILTYRAIVALTLRVGLPPNNLRLVTAVILILALVSRTHAGLLAWPGSARARKLGRSNTQFLEDDKVMPVL